jgi:hypothetical protein
MTEIRLARAAAQEVAGTVTSISLVLYYHQRDVNNLLNSSIFSNYQNINVEVERIPSPYLLLQEIAQKLDKNNHLQ